MEVNASDKHTSLLRHRNNNCGKKFYSTGPWGLCYKTLLVINLQKIDIIHSKLEVCSIVSHKHARVYKLLHSWVLTKLTHLIPVQL
jgi:hypothetical protein